MLVDDDNINDNDDDGDNNRGDANRPFRRPRTETGHLTRRTKRVGYKDQEKVQVDFLVWALLFFTNTGGKYAAKYSDEDDNVEKSVPHEGLDCLSEN